MDWESAPDALSMGGGSVGESTEEQPTDKDNSRHNQNKTTTGNPLGMINLPCCFSHLDVIILPCGNGIIRG
jgi:hypothetical protein